MPLPAELELMASETTPLIQQDPAAGHVRGGAAHDAEEESFRVKLYAFLEAKTPAGRAYERFIVVLIALNVAAFILGSLFLPQYNDQPWAAHWSDKNGAQGLCGKLCDTLWFGNFPDNGLAFLNIGSTSILGEYITRTSSGGNFEEIFFEKSVAVPEGL